MSVRRKETRIVERRTPPGQAQGKLSSALSEVEGSADWLRKNQPGGVPPGTRASGPPPASGATLARDFRSQISAFRLPAVDIETRERAG